MIEITEEMDHQKEWYKEAEGMTVEKLPAFLEKLTTEYQHDYGTICHALSAAAVAAAWAVEHSDQGGITGFQAGAVMWGFIQNWDSSYAKGPARILKMGNMLYPQHKDEFTTITTNTWEWLQKESKKKLQGKQDAHPDVIAHWKSVASGKVPFGFTVQE